MVDYKEAYEQLQKKYEALYQHNRILKDALYFYAEPLSEYDGGKRARRAVSVQIEKYKPIPYLASQMYKNKEQAFIQFDYYIDTREDSDEAIED